MQGGPRHGWGARGCDACRLTSVMAAVAGCLHAPASETAGAPVQGANSQGIGMDDVIWWRSVGGSTQHGLVRSLLRDGGWHQARWHVQLLSTYLLLPGKGPGKAQYAIHSKQGSEFLHPYTPRVAKHPARSDSR